MQNCVGAVTAKSLKSSHRNCPTIHSDNVELHWILMADAKFQILYNAMAMGDSADIYDPMMDAMKLELLTPNPFPAPRAPKGSKVKQPFTLVGDHRYSERSWLRVAKYGQEEQNLEVQRAMTPANIALNMLVTRFGFLQLKTPLLCQAGIVGNAIPILHNYLLRVSPAYGDLDRLAAEYKAEPVPPPPKPRRFAPERAHEAMARIKMEDSNFKTLIDRSAVVTSFLTSFLRFIGLGHYEEAMQLPLSIGMTKLHTDLPEYCQRVSGLWARRRL